MNELSAYLAKRGKLEEFTLFIDRDGVINEPIVNDYARKPADFILVNKAVEAIGLLQNVFKQIVVLTNQQGIHRKLMGEKDLENIHLKLYNALKSENIPYPEAVFFAPYLKKINHTWRKPNTGMPEQAKNYVPSIDFNKSIVVGDSPGDMELADQIGAVKIKIANPQFSFENQDAEFASLWEMAKYLTQN